MDRIPWTPAMVSNAGDFATAAIRNYWEHRLVREAMVVAAAHQPIRVAYDIGTGYGRMTRVLAEFANQVIGFERDPSLLAKGRILNPDVVFVPIQHVGAIPAEDGSADFALTFTVLQHLTDATCHAALLEIKRLVKHGHILLVEEADEAQSIRDLPHDETACCRHRSVERYKAEMWPWNLTGTWPRRIEPTALQPDVGTAMLFASDAQNLG